MILRLMVRMGASAPLLLSGLRRPLRVGADGVQKTRRDDVAIVLVGGERTRRRRTEDERQTRRRTDTHGTMQTQRRFRERHYEPQTFDTANFSWGLCPQTPIFSRFALGFKHVTLSHAHIQRFFPSFTSKNTRPPARNRPPERCRERTTLGEFLQFFTKKKFCGLFPRKKNLRKKKFFGEKLFLRHKKFLRKTFFP